MATSAKDLRVTIDDHLGKLPSLDELGDARYHSTHETFEAASNQRALIIDWLEDLADRTPFPRNREARLLSVGCGGGVMDRRIVDVFADHVESLSLVGVDPNPEHTSAFMEQITSGGFPVQVHTGMFESFSTEKQFDIIHFVHCLYYFEHIEPELRKAVDMLAPGGVLVVLQAPNEALNHLADRVWKKQFDQSAWYSDDVVAVLNGMDVDYRVHRIDAELDVTACFEPDNETGQEILDFIVQADTRKLTRTLQASIDESLRSICRQRGQHLFCAHPVDAIAVTKRA